MEVHRQQCQSCMTADVTCILAREANSPTAVYVRCNQCGRLVARYGLDDYYHHGKGIDSFLRSKRTAVEESGRRMIREFEQAKEQAMTGYKRVLDELNRQGKEI